MYKKTSYHYPEYCLGPDVRKMSRKDHCRKFHHKYILLIILLIPFITIQTSCHKLVDIPQPINNLTDEAAYSTDASATSVLNGLYVGMSQPSLGNYTGVEGFQASASLSSDELYLAVSGNAQAFFFQNVLINNIDQGGNSWPDLYNYIYRCNAIIEGLTASETLSANVKQQLLGEARFFRAFCYFHLVNLFGPVPLATSTDYKVNTLLSRAPVVEVYQLIINDLKQAQELLSEQFLNGSANASTIERTRPNKWAATALLARVYLYNGDYSKAAGEASAVINNSTLFSLEALNNVFLKNSGEAIWQLQPVATFFNTEDAKMFIIPSTGFDNQTPFYLSPTLINSFEPGDMRRITGNWIDSIDLNGSTYYYAFKYKNNTYNPDINPDNGIQFMTEYQMVLRLGEQYLIRAEARAQQNDISDAISDLDMIRNRANLPLIADINPGITQSALIDAIYHERQVELFTEGCHRWFDLKRTGRVDAVMSLETILKGGEWDSREAFYPLPRTELEKAPNLVQNPGYPDF